MALPKGFVDLAAASDAPSGTFVSIIGAVVDIMPPTTTRSNEYMFTFKLLDPRLHASVHGFRGLTVRFFKADQRLLPKVRNIGDIVLLRQIKMQPYANQPVALSNYQTGALVFPAAAIPDANYSIAYQGTDRMNCLGVPADVEKLSLEEQAYVIHLKAQLSATIAQIPTAPAAEQSRKRDPQPLPESGPPEKKAKQSGLGHKFQLVEDLRHQKFADICAEVVKKFPNKYGTCELYVTDYTENKDMWYYRPPEEETGGQRDGDEYGYSGIQKKTWPGPYGWLVLKVNMKDPHAHFANNNVEEGDIVLLRNVKMKIMKEGAKLEGDMWPDDRNPEKLLVTKMKPDLYKTPEINDLLAQKEKYWAARKAKNAQHQQQPDGQPKLTKTEKKRRQKLRKKENALNAAGGADAADGQQGGASTKRDDGTNKYIRCSTEEASLSSVRDILDPDNVRHTAKLQGHTQVIPFINAKYRAKVRVVDFEPKAIEDFAVPPLPEEDEEASPIDAMDWEASPSYEWFFELLLEDASTATQTTGPGTEQKEQVWVSLAHAEAQYLLGKDMPDPRDLRHSPQLLAKLKEKLCILWGNLEEKGVEEALSNRSFECCLMEYGIEMDDDDPEKKLAAFGYKKMFRMFGTTIL
ncbi:hypothetical protein LTR85_008764 [Meristemomyces frigidus]|nr:hypothetical protein LTR85_008764 [Meristemomyces frigidus]